MNSSFKSWSVLKACMWKLGGGVSGGVWRKTRCSRQWVRYKMTYKNSRGTGNLPPPSEHRNMAPSRQPQIWLSFIHSPKPTVSLKALSQKRRSRVIIDLDKKNSLLEIELKCQRESLKSGCFPEAPVKYYSACSTLHHRSHAAGNRARKGDN